KLVILAREAGYDIEPDQVRVESLVPAHCEEGSIDHFFENGDVPGDAVVRDEVLVEIETDKVVLEVPASADGILDAVLEEEGTTV
ncbi:hypothetical protein MJM28_30405, partial [Salmonella enterica subsp. enterica serovar Montevideo]|nr:hypothetical protein [Salmonella enterica subsp. enterica serovar Montevideo]